MTGEPATPSEERPLVTFAVFAYNQEKYIREAVEGAFSQTYEPLEIILSDDCSTDRTFEIMQEMRAGYRGPHRVILNRNNINLGTVNHVIRVASIASGSLFVVAAGDDVSYSHRTSLLFEKWRNTHAIALCSWHDEISEDGSLIRQNVSFPTNLPGFCASYSIRFWRELPYSEQKLFAEDGLASWILRIRGQKVERVDVALVAYRILRDSLSIREESFIASRIWQREEKIAQRGRELVATTRYIVNHSLPSQVLIDKRSTKLLTNDIVYGCVVSEFWKQTHVERMRSILKCRDRKSFLFVAPRIFGRGVFQSLRVALHHFRRLKNRATQYEQMVR